MTEELAAAQPVQRRSRASTERMLACACELFVAGGYEAVAVGEVARRAGVAVGTIYGRFGSKDGLVNAVQSRLLDSFRQDLQARERSEAWTETAPEHLVATLVRDMADLLAAHSGSLGPIMQRANVDAHTATTGKAAYEAFRVAFLRAARRAHPLIRRADPQRACESCFLIAYATFARMLGLGSSPDAADAERLGEVAHELALMCEAYLLWAG